MIKKKIVSDEGVVEHLFTGTVGEAIEDGMDSDFILSMVGTMLSNGMTKIIIEDYSIDNLNTMKVKFSLNEKEEKAYLEFVEEDEVV